MKKIDKARNELLSRIPPVVAEHVLGHELSKVGQQYKLGESTRLRLKREPRKVSLKWGASPILNIKSYKSTFDKLELIQAFCNPLSRYYVSHYSALYWNELVQQQPKDYYLTREAQARRPVHTNDYDPDRIKQAFLKSPRHTSQFASYRDSKIYLIEKQGLSEMGVTTKTIEIQKTPISLRLTNIERTLIDSVISPFYSGGILTVIAAFDKAKINIRDLYNIYEKYSLFYPYWQAIGFILENVKGRELAEDWKSFFDMNKSSAFYLDRQFRSDWLYSEPWKLYYPRGVFHDSH
ncbi:MAG: hypothetical protein EA369_05700 [Bradymonadales bacterium]|nr:MAG: hypothetical protein EA369_05700 [Bradymonadales bacterium]